MKGKKQRQMVILKKADYIRQVLLDRGIVLSDNKRWYHLVV